MPPENLDELDRKILRALADDARNVTTEEIAERVGLASSTVAARINDLEDEGVIEGYAPMIDYRQAGFDPHMILFGTAIDDEFSIDATLAVDGVTCVRRLATDEENVLIELVAATQEEIERRLDALDERGVEITRTEVLRDEESQPLGGFGDETP
ncbi:MAG TPA: winged helix-turn-helix transcriptional regulator [Natronoarchaeum rubrum]|nr:winged helix-turn-helix transcriptional regulator [Natronoarchaeum rubrum]